MNLFSLAKKFPTEEHALAYWMKTRWPDGVRCLACDHDKCYLIETKGKTGKVARLFECADCGLHFSATTNSLFHDSHLPLQKWFMAISLMVEAKKGISANQMKRHIGVTYKTAWYVCHRIRQAMQEDPNFMVGGPMTTVEIDETYVGGRKRLQGHKAPIKGKTAVLGLAERDGQIHMQKMKSIGLSLMREAIAQRLDSDTPHVVTDGKPLYKGVIPTIKHDRGNHKEELKDKNWTNTYTVESAFSLFKRGIVGNYHKLSVEHLDRYLGEFCWRYNRRHQQSHLFDMALHNLANRKPLPYKDLTF
jgi:transposase-like protein